MATKYVNTANARAEAQKAAAAAAVVANEKAQAQQQAQLAQAMGISVVPQGGSISSILPPSSAPSASTPSTINEQLSTQGVSFYPGDPGYNLANAMQNGGASVIYNPNVISGYIWEGNKQKIAGYGAYQLVDNSGNVIANVNPVANNPGVFQVNAGNPSSEGSISGYIQTNQSGQVNPIDWSTQFSYTPGSSGSFLSGLQSALGPVLPLAEAAGLSYLTGGLGDVLGIPAAIADPALASAGTTALQGGSPEQILTSGVAGGASGYLGPATAGAVGSATSSPTVASALGGAVGGAVPAAITGGNVLAGALGGGIASGTAQGLIGQNIDPTLSKTIGATTGGALGALATGGNVPLSSAISGANALTGALGTTPTQTPTSTTASSGGQEVNFNPNSVDPTQYMTTTTDQGGGLPSSQGGYNFGITDSAIPDYAQATQANFNTGTGIYNLPNYNIYDASSFNLGDVPQLSPISATAQPLYDITNTTNVPQLSPITATAQPLYDITNTTQPTSSTPDSTPSGTQAPDYTLVYPNVIPGMSGVGTGAGAGTGAPVSAGLAALGQALSISPDIAQTGQQQTGQQKETGQQRQLVWNTESLKNVLGIA